jgi:large subunit ribosomal protein L21
MYAIVDIAGQQFKVEEGKKVYVHRLAEEEGKTVKLDKILLIDDDKNVKIGDPIVSGASIDAKVVSHLRGDKVIVFKKKRRKGYQIRNGHRQNFTELMIEKISAK